MNYMVKIKCNVPNDIFELPPIRNTLASAYVTQGNRIKERYEEIYSYLRENGLEGNEMLEYVHILTLFKIYVHKAFLNEAVERIFDVERICCPLYIFWLTDNPFYHKFLIFCVRLFYLGLLISTGRHIHLSKNICSSPIVRYCKIR